MIEVTCAACGTVNRIAEADVPAGAKFVNCTSCKSRVPVPAAAAAAPGPGPVKATVTSLPPSKIPAIPAGLGRAGVPASIPSIPPIAVPNVPALPAKSVPAKPLNPTTKASGNTNDIIDLADLPAPKRTSALGGTPESRPAPKSGLAAAADASADIADLPAPRDKRRNTPSPLAAATPSVPGAGAIDLDDLLAPVARDIVDLPAPRGPAAGITDLPAPRGPSAGGVTDLPAPKLRSAGLADLPAPKVPRGIVDLPAPKGLAGITDLPAPKVPAGITDLPAPKVPAGIVDLPAPKVPAGIVDLPAPKVGAGIVDLPAPRADLPAPKGFFDDLPQPGGGGGKAPGLTDVPAPKGFFDDLPQPQSKAAARATVDVPAPKGFFDDIPQPTKPPAGVTDVPAPKGFFDDLVQPVAPKPPRTTTTAPVAPLVAPGAPAAPPQAGPKKGFFDDIPVESLGGGPAATSPAAQPSGSLDIDPLGFEPAALPASTVASVRIASGKPASNAPVELDLELASPTSGSSPSLELEAPPASTKGFEDLDLSSPTAPPPPKVMDQNRRSTGAAPPLPKGMGDRPMAQQAGGDLALELEEPRDREKQEQRKAPPAAKKAAADAAVDPKVAKRKRTIILGAVLGIAVAGGAGAMLYKKHAAAQQEQEEIDTQLATARSALAATDATHWSRAFGAANQVVQTDGSQVAAVGIAAEASMAGALDDGQGYDARIANGRRLISTALQAHLQGPELSRAIALQAILGTPPATTALEGLHKQAPKDLAIGLYLGWGQALKGDHAAAIATFDSLVTTPVKLTALYWRGKSKLAMADLDGATADFNAVLADARDHIGAMVGLAQALPPAKIAEQETDINAITHRKDFEHADPRVRVLAYLILGDDAQHGGRLDVARASYRQAQTISPNDIAAMAGLAEVELRDGKLAEAKEASQKAVRLAPANARAQLATSEYEIANKQYDDAQKRLSALAGRQPPLAPLEQARLQLLTGQLHEALKEDDQAVDAYVAGAKIAGELDLSPTMAAVRVLTRMAASTDDKDKAAAFKAKAADLLGALEAKAKADPQLALALGVAYLQSGDAAKAEPLLQSAADARPQDPDPLFQLARSQEKQGKVETAIANLKKARGMDATRVEFGFELARAFELGKQDGEAGTLYDSLLAVGAELPLEMRGRACVYYGRIGKIDKARAQGAEIEKTDAANPQGLYCRAEGLLLDKKGDAARGLFAQAVQIDPTNAQYLDAQGRAAELVVEQANDSKFADEALRVYQAAAQADPTMLNPYLGQARIYVTRKDWTKAQAVLGAADKLKAGDPDITYMYGISLEGDGKLADAVNWLQASANVRPTADVFHHLGEDYHALNNPEKTMANWSRAIELGREDEKKTGTKPAWFVDTLYLLGDLYPDENPRKRELWKEFVENHPPQGVHLDHAKQALSSSLKQ